MPAERRRILVVDVAALGWDLVSKARPAGLEFHRAGTVFPALTCSVQASFRTASLPRDHGVIANGLFSGDVRRVLFWEQSAGLVAGPRIWQNARHAGCKVGVLFWQQSLGEQADIILSPRPIHKHHGGMIQDCYSQPPDLYERLTESVGRPFNLMHYWGPLASARSSDWIVDATIAVMKTPGLAPDLLLSYIPHLDYDLQRFGPDSPQAARALDVVAGYLRRLGDAAAEAGYEFLFLGDYAIEAITGEAVFPNRALLDAGFLHVRTVRGMKYPDLFTSAAFAMADHQVAHVYVPDPDAAGRVRRVLETLEGVGEILDRPGQRDAGLDVSRSGEFVLVAAPGRWFAYPWWRAPAEAPDFAGHVDIHNKPGYDPCELFFGWPPGRISSDTGRVRGTHGRRGAGTDVAWASSLAFETPPSSVLDLAREVRGRLNRGA